jgi:hypothetical protein
MSHRTVPYVNTLTEIRMPVSAEILATARTPKTLGIPETVRTSEPKGMSAIAGMSATAGMQGTIVTQEAEGCQQQQQKV